MKVSNETKVGALAIIVIIMMILGFNFLKGNHLFSKSMTLHAVYSNIQGLATSNPVVVNGFQVGTVDKIESDQNMRQMIVTLSLKENLKIPKNSIALIIPNPLGTPKIEIKLGDTSVYLQNKDTLFTEVPKGLLDDVMKKVDPVLFEVKNAVSTLDTLLANVNGLVDANNKHNISSTIEHLNQISAAILVSVNSLNDMLDAKNGSIAKTFDHTNSITGNLAASNGKITDIVNNLDKISGKLAQADLQKTLSTLDSTIGELKTTIHKLNSKDGSIGLLLNDPALYKNLTATGNKVNLLLDDIRVHPKRYINISVFGKKQKSQPLSTPLPDTLNAPYTNQKATSSN